jgi:hypothetical protein
LAAVSVEEMQAHVKHLFEKVHIRMTVTGNVYKDVSTSRYSENFDMAIKGGVYRKQLVWLIWLKKSFLLPLYRPMRCWSGH